MLQATFIYTNLFSQSLLVVLSAFMLVNMTFYPPASHSRCFITTHHYETYCIDIIVCNMWLNADNHSMEHLQLTKIK